VKVASRNFNRHCNQPRAFSFTLLTTDNSFLSASHTHNPHTVQCLRHNHGQPLRAVEAQLVVVEEVSHPEEDAVVDLTQSMETNESQRRPKKMAR